MNQRQPFWAIFLYPAILVGISFISILSAAIMALLGKSESAWTAALFSVYPILIVLMLAAWLGVLMLFGWLLRFASRKLSK